MLLPKIIFLCTNTQLTFVVFDNLQIFYKIWKIQYTIQYNTKQYSINYTKKCTLITENESHSSQGQLLNVNFDLVLAHQIKYRQRIFLNSHTPLNFFTYAVPSTLSNNSQILLCFVTTCVTEVGVTCSLPKNIFNG